LFLGVNFVGVVDYGLQDNNEQPATNALVFMVVAVNGSFKIPIAHFFTTGINAQGKMQLSTFCVANLLLLLVSNCLKVCLLLGGVPIADNVDTALLLMLMSLLFHASLLLLLTLLFLLLASILSLSFLVTLLLFTFGVLRQCVGEGRSGNALGQHTQCLSALPSAFS
jgi:hypothetical protein